MGAELEISSVPPSEALFWMLRLLVFGLGFTWCLFTLCLAASGWGRAGSIAHAPMFVRVLLAPLGVSLWICGIGFLVLGCFGLVAAVVESLLGPLSWTAANSLLLAGIGLVPWWAGSRILGQVRPQRDVVKPKGQAWDLDDL
jgi:hypothetical protein